MVNFDENPTELYENFDEVLADADCDMRVSEYQGLLVGLITAGQNQLTSTHFSLLSELAHDGNGLESSLRNRVTDLFQLSLQRMSDNDQLTPILIADDNYPIVDRIEAVGEWCQGFLLGFGLQSGQPNKLTPEINEALRDISQIANIEIQNDNSEDSLVALETLIEHLKVAVKMIYLEQVGKPRLSRSADGKPTIH